MLNVNFSGTLTGVSSNKPIVGAPIGITVTKPDGTTDQLSATTDASGNFSVDQTYEEGSYSAIASFAGDADHSAGTSPSVPFTVAAEAVNLSLNIKVG